MAQNFTGDWYAQSANAHAAFGNAENNDNCLKSNFSGGSAPSNAVAGMPWYHSTKGLRIRNAGNAAWLKALQGDAATKIPMYRNDTMEGWLIDASVTDKVVAIKGGTAAYNVPGGNVNGSWTITGLAAGNDDADHAHATPEYAHSVTLINVGEPIFEGGYITVVNGVSNHAASGTGGRSAYHQHPITHDGWTRPLAAVCTLQYPDLG
jgi:hypothetical protein